MDTMPAVTESRAYPGTQISPPPSSASRMRESSDISQLAPDLVSAINEIANPQRNRSVSVTAANNDTYDFSYATLDAINAVARPVLAAHNICVMQPIVTRERAVLLVTRLLHRSGQWMESEIPIVAPGSNLKAFGSAVTYVRRYALSAILNIVLDEDDDASAATGCHIQGRALQHDGKHADGESREGGQGDHPTKPTLALTHDQNAVSDPLQAIVARARSARAPEDGQALLEAVQQHSADIERYRGSDEWQSMLVELRAGLKASLGPDLATVVADGFRALSQQDLDNFTKSWKGPWAKAIAELEAKAPAIHALIRQHANTQADRVTAANPRPRKVKADTQPSTQQAAPEAGDAREKAA